MSEGYEMKDLTLLSIKEVLNDFDENYAKVRKLVDDSKNDPENMPYTSKYQAREILRCMYDSLQKLTEAGTELDDLTRKAMIGVVLLNIGAIELDVEELAASEKTFTEVVELLEPDGDSPQLVISLVSAYNHLAILWFNRNESKKSLTYLFKAKKLYDTFKTTAKLPMSVEDILDLDGEELGDPVLLEKAFTLTLYYLAQVYGSLQMNLKSAVYCHITLKRQLELKDYDPIDWALNSATLAQVFAEQDGFLQSRHHLAAASTILEKYEKELSDAESNDEAYLAKKEIFNHRSADVARCWAKYCLLLMSASKDRLMRDDQRPNVYISELSKLTFSDQEKISGVDVTKLSFPELDVSKYESQVSCKYLLTYEDTRQVFLCCQEWLNNAKEFYKLDTLASDYIEIAQDYSLAYSYLAFFEEDDDRRSKMHKRRVVLLEELLKQVNPVYYLQYCKQIWYELGEVYSDMLNIKLDKHENIQGPLVPQALKKINKLCEKSIENFNAYLNSIKDKEGKIPLPLPEELIDSVISSYAIMGRNCIKRIAADKKMQMDFVQQSLDAFQAAVDICTADEVVATRMREEFRLCQEMVKILPLKIKTLEQSINAQQT